jgi:hypothetical protein
LNRWKHVIKNIGRLRKLIKVTGTRELELALALPTPKKCFGLDTKQDCLMPDPLDKFRQKFEMEE